MGKKLPEKTSLAPVDNSSDELFASLKGLEEKSESKLSLSYIPSFFTTASLPFKNINKTEFVRKGSNGISLILNSPKNVPFGKYGRLLLSVFTTHAVISKIKDAPVEIEFESLSQLLREMQLPRQRGQDIQEQLECFKKATFSFEQKVEKQEQAYLFKNLYGPDEKLPKRDVTVRTTSTGTILFTEGVQYQEIFDEKSKNPRIGKFKIILSANFAHFCQQHGVPINYTVYKDISSPVGKDIYAWLVYRNNSNIKPEGVFIPREKLVEQFMPVAEESDPKIANVNYARIIDQVREIKEKYYPELNVEIDKGGTGLTLFKSPTPVLKDDIRYALISANMDI
ncbi:plasmid encoded RepA protein [Treponema sp. Marseille-Q3903]|uniref:plasmid encoded RepA protein n=1 Tax=Treponema sp. Marseille-Q3903 TaxID=2766703 RepID=UPI001651DCC4|nr:plasmid encoded RepA protein [Treponema sp. Marseille-Q3903]MBC6714496.1 plasmid encoded RepA protein [Treponema sp. Marseille-Q3903]